MVAGGVEHEDAHTSAQWLVGHRLFPLRTSVMAIDIDITYQHAAPERNMEPHYPDV